jgi:hypothetical protein
MRIATFGCTLTLALLAGCALQAQGQQGPKAAERRASEPALGTGAVVRAASSPRVPLLSEPLRLSDFEAMEPKPELQEKLLKISGFIQNTPQDGHAGTEETEVWTGYTHSAIYFVFVCHDRHPELIRSHLARRENILKDEYVSVLLDPFEDRRKGVLFQVNPAGVQADAAWTEPSTASASDYSYDQVWDSEARITPQGWMALIAIPFRSLRFRSGSAWGVVLIRSIPRKSEMDLWPRVAAGVSGYLSQEASLSGIEGVAGSHNVQINPYTLGQNERILQTQNPLNPYWSSRHQEATAGGEFKAILKDRIVIDATINPDFSDVESDQPQFTVDQRYPVYFPELRPFFLENANYFTTPIKLLYTRTIAHPEYGARVTGKLGHTNLGFLAVDDRAPGETVSIGDPLYHTRARAVVARLSQDIGKGSSVGLIYAGEEFAGGWNRIGGIDFTARINDHWTASGQWAESSTRGDVDSGSPRPYSAGPAVSFRITRSGHSFEVENDYKDISTGFQTQLGFIQSSNIRADYTHAQHQWFPEHGKVQSYGLEAEQQTAFDHSGNRVYRYLSVDPFITLPGNTVLAPVFGQNSDTVGPQNGYPLTENRNFSENFAGFVARGAPWAPLNFNLQAFSGSNVNYNPVSGGAPFLMRQLQVMAIFTLQPFRRLTYDNTYLLDRNRAAQGGALVYESQTFRAKVNYQFTRALSARAIVEYDSTLANPALTSLQRTKQVASQALVTWMPHPGTNIYIGYSNDLQNLDRSLCNRLSTGACDPDNTATPRATQMLNDGKQIFIKASYLLRF